MMKLKPLIAALLVSALCLGTISACSKSDQTAEDVAYLRKQKEKEVVEKAEAVKKSEAEAARARDYFKNNPTK
jgi:outer membrane murein-binding lipoprotein Lpp